MTQPSNEARISNLEKESMTLGARIEELASDTDNNFRALRQEMKDGFLEMGKAFDLNAANIEEVKREVAGIRQDIVELKGDMICMETRIIDTFKQLLQQKSGE